MGSPPMSYKRPCQYIAEEVGVQFSSAENVANVTVKRLRDYKSDVELALRFAKLVMEQFSHELEYNAKDGTVMITDDTVKQLIDYAKGFTGRA